MPPELQPVMRTDLRAIVLKVAVRMWIVEEVAWARRWVYSVGIAAIDGLYCRIVI